MANTLFMNPGTDETQDFSSFFDTFTTATGAVSSATDQAHTGGRSIKAVAASAGDLAGCATFDGTCKDAGTCISFWARFSTVTPTGQVLIFTTETTGDGTPIIGVAMGTGSKLVLCGKKTGGGLSVAGSATIVANTWTRITLSYVITSVSSYTAKMYVNGVLDATMTNATGTLAAANAVCMAFLTSNSNLDMSCNTPGAITVWYDDIFSDDRTDQSDCGDIRVTAKRPIANGTTNGFTTQIGSGGSGTGTGHSPQVNERPLSQTNGWSMVGAGVAVTEEYNVEGSTAGDVSLAGATIVDWMGWVFAKSSGSQTASIVTGGASSNIALTTVATMYQKIKGSTTYPAGTGTDVGIVTTAALQTVSLYEAGILVAFNPSTGTTFTSAGTSLGLTGGTPLLQIGLIVAASAALALSAGTPSIGGSGVTTINPAGTTLSLAGGTPALSFGTTIKPTGATLALTSSSPSINIQTTPAAATGLVLTGNTPTLSLGTSRAPTVATLALTGGTPTIQFGLAPAAATLVLSLATPTVNGSGAISPVGATLALTGSTPMFQLGLAPTAAALALTPGTPSLARGTTFAPGGTSLALAGGTPSLQLGFVPTIAVLVLSPGTPSINGSGQISPLGTSLALVGGTPSLQLGLVPVGAALALTGNTPTVGANGGIAPAGTSLGLTGGTPTLQIGITPAGTSLSLVTGTPSVSSNNNPAPLPATLALTGGTPSLRISLSPAGASLSLVGGTPQVGQPRIINLTWSTRTITLNWS